MERKDIKMKEDINVGVLEEVTDNDILEEITDKEKDTILNSMIDLLLSKGRSLSEVIAGIDSEMPTKEERLEFYECIAELRDITLEEIAELRGTTLEEIEKSN